MVFDVDIYSTRKARFVEGVHCTGPLKSFTYAYVVLRDSVSVELLLESVNYIKVLSVYTQGTYLNVPCKENIWFQVRSEFGFSSGRVVIAIMSL